MNRSILITGSTDGIGRNTAAALAKAGHTVHLHGRSEAKLQTVIEELKAESGNHSIAGFVADFSDLKQVKSMAAEVRSRVDSLDVLINNAGVWNSKERLNSDGMDMRFVVNYLAPFLMTKELLPILKKAHGPRIINLSSAAQSSVSLDALKGAQAIGIQEAYAQSKLALTMWSFDLAEKEKDVIVIPVNPGSLLNTKMVREAFGRHYAEVDKGSDILQELAMGETHKRMSGKYFDNDLGGYGQAHPDAYNKELNEQLMQATESLISE